MHDDRLAALESRFHTLLTKWLADLPPDGWEGTSHQLSDDLATFADRHYPYASVPTCPGRKVAGMVSSLTASGFTVTHHRTKHARTLRFTRR